MSVLSYDISRWGFFRFHGPDVKPFLQGLVSADLAALKPGVCLPACVLTPKGLLVADCEFYEETDGVALAVVRPDAVAGFEAIFAKRIMLSSSTVKRLDAKQAWLVIGDASRGLPWPRLGGSASLWLGVDPPEGAELLSDAEFHSLRIRAGFPWFGADMNEESLPLEARQDGAISMSKGCYMGQETVSRLVFRGHVNKILMGIRFEAEAPAPGAAVARDGREIGRITSAARNTALAVVRYEDAKAGTKVSSSGRGGELFEFSSWPKPLKP